MCVANTYEQIGRRPEYYWYFNSLQGYNKTKPIMTTMGNNDLLEKKYGQCFARKFGEVKPHLINDENLEIGNVHQA